MCSPQVFRVTESRGVKKRLRLLSKVSSLAPVAMHFCETCVMLKCQGRSTAVEKEMRKRTPFVLLLSFSSAVLQEEKRQNQMTFQFSQASLFSSSSQASYLSWKGEEEEEKKEEGEP